MSRHNLYMFRCEHKLTKREIAKITGVSRSGYANIENGIRVGSQTFWENLQREFDIPDSEMYLLMKREDRNARKTKNSNSNG